MKLLPMAKASGLALCLATSSVYSAPFGNSADLSDAQRVWDAAVEAGYVGENATVTRPYKGAPPHGMILELMEKDVTINGFTGALVVKKNYGGDGISVDDVINDPARFLKAVTIMFKREANYDPENGNWFYAKYTAMGEVMTNPKDVKLAGRVAKGMPTGCIACHQAAPGGDFVFNHDRYK